MSPAVLYRRKGTGMMAAASGCGGQPHADDADDDIAVLSSGRSMIPAADAPDAGRGPNRTLEEMTDAIASVERVLCRTGTSMVGTLFELGLGRFFWRRSVNSTHPTHSLPCTFSAGRVEVDHGCG